MLLATLFGSGKMRNIQGAMNHLKKFNPPKPTHLPYSAPRPQWNTEYIQWTI